MGLDNGLLLHTTTRIRNIPKEVRGRLGDSWVDEDGYVYEVCYWRKCYNIRHRVGKELTGVIDAADYSKEDLDIGDVKSIWHIINHVNNRWIWDYVDDNSIWTYDEIHDQLDEDLLYLEWLIDFMKHNECRVEFYDSY